MTARSWRSAASTRAPSSSSRSPRHRAERSWTGGWEWTPRGWAIGCWTRSSASATSALGSDARSTRCAGPRRSVRASGARDDLGAGLGEDEGLLGLGPGDRRVPRERLPGSDHVVRRRRRDHLAGPVAGQSPLVVEPPLVGVAGASVEAAAVVEHLGESAARTGRLIAHPPKDLLTRLAAAPQLRGRRPDRGRPALGDDLPARRAGAPQARRDGP